MRVSTLIHFRQNGLCFSKNISHLLLCEHRLDSQDRALQARPASVAIFWNSWESFEQWFWKSEAGAAAGPGDQHQHRGAGGHHRQVIQLPGGEDAATGDHKYQLWGKPSTCENCVNCFSGYVFLFFDIFHINVCLGILLAVLWPSSAMFGTMVYYVLAASSSLMTIIHR